ncbi:MAG TPA: DUF229 domain-containing protein [Flavobacteriia bacterium]|nr:DUF229 domain-containing protein [Flavobacteriia bacterium]
MKTLTIIFSIILATISCKAQEKATIKATQPNILWIVTEDISPTLSFYGDTTAKTPNLDALAKESMIYDNAYTTVGVCAPSRSTIITGMYPTSIGTMHMRTGKDVHSWGKRVYKKDYGRNDITGKPIREYSAVIPKNVKCYTEYLRAAGYYCTNNDKTDYQFAAPVTAWDENNKKAHWRNRPKDKPFFAVFNIFITHESQLWKNENLSLTVNPKDVPVPPYLPDNKATRHTIARNYSNIELMDAQVGAFIKQLKDDGLYDNTIIFFYSDHGGPLPHQKREIYDTGLKVPFLIKGINSKTKGRTDRMISFVDLAPTMLSLAGIKIPGYMQGKAFLGTQSAEPRTYIYGSSDRFDGFTDRIRAVRNKQFLYLRNYFPELPKYKDVAYRKNIPMMPVFLKLQKEGKLNAIQNAWFGTKTTEELYDCKNDPHNVVNLADSIAYKDALNEMRLAMLHHQQEAVDLGQIPESQLIDMMWPNFEQPVTKAVALSTIETPQGQMILLKSPTKGASIAYFISDRAEEKLDFDSGWQLYSKPFTTAKGKYIYTIAQRIGYKESKISKIKI